MLLSLLLAVLTNTTQLADALRNEVVGEPFALTGLVTSGTYADDDDFAVQDASGSVIILPPSHDGLPVAGSVIRAQGAIKQSLFGHAIASCKTIDVVSRTNPPPVKAATLHEVQSGSCDASVIRVTGMLRDYFSDEIDPNYMFLILNDGKDTVYVAAMNCSTADTRRLETLVGQRLTITGLCDPHPSGCRRKIGRLIRINNLVAVRLESQVANADPFAVPVLNRSTTVQPALLHTLGRRRTKGRVIAVWQHSSLLLAIGEGQVSRIDIANTPPPSLGASIEIVGFPETDLYRINFSRAIWRDLPSAPFAPEPTTNIMAAALMTDYEQKSAINPDFHGRTIRLRGTVRSLPSIGNDGRFYIESDGYTLPIDISANPSSAGNLDIGSIIEVTGVCIMDIENWRPNLVFPHIKAVLIVTRTPDDIVVIRHPSWWTPARLMIIIGSLLAALIGILIWNRALKALAEKRGKALANEELERLESDLRVCERTRLAVELHDSIAQNLTGVSMEIDTALRGDEPLPPAATQHMGRALRTIDSCRSELRNCLWDLRSQALEEENMNDAIRLTLSQTIGRADLSIRFNAPRSRFTDNSAHTILRIIRELAANAIRHGKATEIKVAGNIEDDVLRFSVRDNGCGFDPDSCPGVLDGHFGLQGIRERVASFEGTIDIQSKPGKGTKVTIAINAPQNDDWEKI